MKFICQLTSSQQTSIEQLLSGALPDFGIEIDKESVCKTVYIIMIILHGV